MKLRVRVLRIAFLAAITFGGFAGAGVVSLATSSQAAAQTVVAAVVVQGNRRVDTEAILGYVAIRPGDRADPLKIDEALKALYATGLFEDVRINMVGNRLVVTVVENPVISRIAFEGNKKVKDETLLAEIQSKARGPLSRTTVQADVQRIIEVYRRSGRYDVRVDPKIIDRGQGRVDLVFEINEGDKTTVKKIVFVGNKAFSDWKLRDVMTTTETNWLSWIKSTDVYDPDRVSADQELLRRFYLKNGYADFRIISANVETDKGAGGFIITITLEEGEQYHTGTVDVISSLRDVDPATIKSFVRTRTGEVYNAELVEKTIEDLTIELAKRGYAFSQVRPRGDRDFAARTINLVYVIEEGPRVYIERINIRGNVRTRDYVIRREFDIYEGDPYNRALIDRAERRLKNLGYFKTVKITNEPGSAPDRVIINVDVEDQLTGEFSIAGGYSTSAGWLAEVSVGERNFLGKGQYVRASVSYGQYARGAELTFSDPYMLGYRVSGGISIYAKEQLQNTYQSYNVSTIGTTLLAGLPLNDDLTLGTRYSIFQRTLSAPPGWTDGCRVLADNSIYPRVGTGPTDLNCTGNSNDGTTITGAAGGWPGGFGLAPLPPGQGYDPNEVSPAIKQALGSTITSSVGYTLSYNTLDNNKDPSMGLLINFNQDFAGLGGDSNYLRSSVDARIYKPLGGDYVGMLRAQGGYIMSTGNNGGNGSLRILDQFFKGPELVRGFQPSGIGPRDLGSQFTDALGGSQYWGATAELQFPLSFMPKELGLKAAIFADAGSLWGYKGGTTFTAFPPYGTGGGQVACPTGTTGPKNNVDVCLADSSSIRSSTGVSLIWTSPFGPIRFDFAKALTRESYDKTQFFRFSGGTNF
ncbi:MAG TPA: outer membrane protein assembly factor BamA [Xanthobacteraceae bacterium]|nr:outer membrane protein assembly factor BamA [Xanthobacteraceae bacterium]